MRLAPDDQTGTGSRAAAEVEGHHGVSAWNLAGARAPRDLLEAVDRHAYARRPHGVTETDQAPAGVHGELTVLGDVPILDGLPRLTGRVNTRVVEDHVPR